MKVGVAVEVGVAVLVMVAVGVAVLVGVAVGVDCMSSTKAQLLAPRASSAQFMNPTVVGVAVAVGTEHGGTPLFGSVTDGAVSSTTSEPELYSVTYG